MNRRGTTLLIAFAPKLECLHIVSTVPEHQSRVSEGTTNCCFKVTKSSNLQVIKKKKIKVIFMDNHPHAIDMAQSFHTGLLKLLTD